MDYYESNIDRICPLYPEPSSCWLAEMAELKKDGFIAKKYERRRRLVDKLQYIKAFCMHLLAPGPGLVIDVGPGPGEFLEIVRSAGRDVLGIDAPSGSGGMGDKYVRLSQLMHLRQNLRVNYAGLLEFIPTKLSQELAGTAVLVNLQGSIEQCFAQYMEGEPHDQHHDCKQLSWRIDNALRAKLCEMFATFASWLIPDGHVLIYCNGAANFQAFAAELHAAAKVGGKFVVSLMDCEGRLIRWRRT